MTCLTPHSKEWFAALAKVNPQEAAHTKQIIKSTGSSEVCSLCGGSDARDYQLTNRWFGSVPATFRLCQDCLSTRSMEGDQFALLESQLF
jgi:hypothetical protein